MTSTKISAAIGLAYGEQGHYSTVTPVEEPQQVEREMIPVRLDAQTLPAAKGPSSETGGACMMDVTGSGSMDLVLMQSGEQALRVLHRRADGGFEELNAAAAGLNVSGHGVRLRRWATTTGIV